MKSLRRNANGIFLCIFEIVVGILLLIDPVTFSSSIIIAVGFLLMLSGAMSILGYFRMEAEEAALSQKMLKGLLFLIAGIFCASKSQWFLSTFPLLTILYGVAILIAGLAKIQWAFNLLRMRREKWFLPAISALVSILCAMFIFADPFSSTETLWIFTGVSLIGEAIFDIVSLLLRGHRKEERKEAMEDHQPNVGAEQEEDEQETDREDSLLPLDKEKSGSV